MGLFGLLGNKPESRPTVKNEKLTAIDPNIRRKALLDIAGIISLDDPVLMAEARECIDHPDAYLTTHEEQYYDWDFGPGAWDDLKRIQWIGLVMMLEAKNYVCCRDWKDERPDFVHFLRELAGTKRLGLKIQEDWLDEKDGVEQWLSHLNGIWKTDKCCVGVLGTNSDSYAMFMCRIAERDRLAELAAQAGEVIE